MDEISPKLQAETMEKRHEYFEEYANGEYTTPRTFGGMQFECLKALYQLEKEKPSSYFYPRELALVIYGEPRQSYAKKNAYASKLCQELLRTGLIEKAGRGQFRITWEGIAYIEYLDIVK